MTTRPTDFPNWASDTNYTAPGDPWDASATKVAPSDGLVASGYVPGALRPAVVDNYLWSLVQQYVSWFIQRLAGVVLSNWTVVDTGVTDQMLCIVYADTLGLWIASFNGAIYRSSNLATWTSCSAGTAINYIGWGNSTLVAVGATGELLTSTNGTSWTSRTSGTTENLCGAAYGDSLWVVTGGNGVVLTSSNLSTWSAPSGGPSTTATIYSAVYAAELDLWVAVGGSSSNVWTAPNSTTTWTARSTGIGAATLKSVCWDGSYFHAVGGSTGISSSSGTSWTGITWGTSLCTMNQVVYLSEFQAIVAVGYTSGAAAPLVRTSTAKTDPGSMTITDRSPTDAYGLLGIAYSANKIAIATDENTNAKVYQSIAF